MDPILENFIDGKFFLSQFNAVYKHVSGNHKFLTDSLTRETEYLNNDDSRKT